MDRMQTTHAHDKHLAIGPVELTTRARRAPSHITRPQVGHAIENVRGNDNVSTIVNWDVTVGTSDRAYRSRTIARECTLLSNGIHKH